MRHRKTDRHLPPCVYQKHGAYWYVKSGKWTRLSDDYREALREYSRIASPTKNGMEGLMSRWLQSVTPHIKPATLKLYRQSAAHIAEVFAEFDPAQIKPRTVAQWLESEGQKPAWTNRARTVLKLAMDKAVLWGMADSNPVVSIPRAKQPERTRYITDGEYQAIHAQASPELKIIMGLCFYTAQRIGDVLSIRFADLTEAGIAFTQEKTGARLVVAWTPELRKLIEDAKGLGGNVRGMYLLCYRGKPWRYHAIYQRWIDACKAAKVKNAHIHDLRAKSLTDGTRQGINAQALAGHSSQAMTDHYVKQRDIPVVQSPKFGTGF